VPVASFLTPPSGAGGLGAETEQYYFHPNHLGSSNYITNIAGEVSQHTEYFAFGETFVEEHKNSNNSPYKFNGKELDEESGLYYYGARYYDPRISIWASVDPLAERGPEFSPYSFCFNNPMHFTDPDGRWPFPSWSSITKSTSAYISKQSAKISSDWKNIKRELYNGKGADDFVKDVKQSAKDTQKWVKNNKQALLKLGNNLEDAGDAMTITGYGAAVVGAPIAGVGAAPGVALASAGNVVNLVGAGIIVLTNVIAADDKSLKEAGKEALWTGGGEALDFVVDRIVPGPTPDVSDATKKIIETGNEVLKKGVTTKAIIIEHAVKE
jgi:RHS repeat-associated protein